MEVDADDDFGPSLVAEEDKAAVVTNQADPSRPSRSIVALVRSVSSCLIRIPASQSGSNEPSRQEDLFDQLDECDPFRFVLFGSVLFEAVRLEHLHISASAADRVLEAFQEYFSAYSFSRDESMHLLAISFLEATSHLWLQPSVSEADFGVHVRLSCSYFIKNLELGKLRTGRIRARFLRFVELYLELDPTESFWKLPLGLEGNDKLLSARRFVIPLVRDVDVQVRFEAAVILPNLFNFVAKVERQPIPFYMSFYDEADVLGSTEQHVTTALLLANSIVVSAFVRKAAYFHLLEAFSNHPEASLFHLEIALRSAASALGLGSLFALWELYNPAVELQLHLLKQDGSIVPEVPASLLGYSNRKQNSDMVLRRFGAWLVGRGDHDRFLELCRASGKTDEEGYLECLPSSIACLLINPQESVKSSDFIKKVDRLIRLAGLDHSVAGYLNNSLDAILTACLAALIDADKIGSVLEKKQLDKFQQLSLPSYDSSHSMLLLAPRATPELIVRAFDWLIGNSGKDRMSDDAIASNVLFSLATRAGKTPLILEQTRIVYSISILISLFHSAFKNITILRSLLHLTTSLMTQRELVPIIHGFLRWGLARLPVTKVERSPGIDEVLVRIASLGQALQASSNPPDIVEIGSSLLGKLEEAVHKIVTEDHALRGQAQDALYLWPRPLSPELARCCPVQDASRLSRVLVRASFPPRTVRGPRAS
jgi:ataxia telangiectasia mutated family protein